MKLNISAELAAPNAHRQAGARKSAHIAVGSLGAAFSLQAAATLIMQATSFGALIAVAHLLGKAVYGYFALTQTTVNTFTSVAALGLGVTATKHVSQYCRTDPARVGRTLALASSVALIAALIFSTAYAFLCPSLVGPDHALAVRIGAACIFFTTLNGYQLGALSGFEAFGAIARTTLMAALCNLAVTSLAAKLLGLTGAIVALSCNSFLQWLLCHFALKHQCRIWNCRPTHGEALREKHILFSTSTPASIAALVFSAGNWGSTVLLSKQSNGFGELAVYGVANSFRLVLMFLPSILARVMLPRLSVLRSLEAESQFRRAFTLYVAGSFGIAASMALVLGALHRPVLQLFGNSYAASAPILALVLASAVLEIFAGALSQALIIADYMWAQAAIMALWSVTLFLCSRCAFTGGAHGLATANIMAWGAASLCYFALVPYAVRMSATKSSG